MLTKPHVTDSHRHLDHLSPEAFAWEFLRRNKEYQAAYRSIVQRWGCVADPDLPTDQAQIMWADPTFQTKR